MSKSQVMYPLASGTVIDRSVLIGLTSTEIRDAFLDARKPILVVDRASQFFTSANMLALIEAADDNYKLIAENAGIVMSDLEAASLQRAVELRKEITSRMIPPVPPYEFAKVPDDWEFAANISISGNSIRRVKVNGFVDGGVSHSIGVKQAQRLWNRASGRWAKLPNMGEQWIDVRIGSYESQSGRIEPTYIKIGCQTIQRFELEQLALFLNWDFPEVPAL